ncbi:hypothetical protein [Saccharothrix australiensis]|uniref:PhiE125 gp8 family phage protein n=1 Tax=Saccharothrix australiensis TaxID=2072 RepID=A0A495VLE7_9PSEU|nr:hypothetical protein [Saccharothrix australiensis]RKT49357.1 hypothetical protein C8E97_6736 [Saccharothrix australiensis]
MAYDLGDTAQLRVEVRDAGGALAEPGSAPVLTITLPDGSTSTPAVANPSVGVYTASYPTAQAGRHTVRWVATGANATAEVDILDVRPADRGWLISLADAREMLNLRSTADDAELRDWLGAVTVVVERTTGIAWVRRSRVETARGGRPGIALTHRPITAVTGMVPLSAGGTTYQPADLTWTPSGVLRLRSGAAFRAGEYTISYVAGDDAAIPEHVTAAARIILKHLWETQRGGSSLPSRGGDEDYEAALIGYAIPNRAIELLGKPVGGFA